MNGDKRRGFKISLVNSCYHEPFHGERKRRKSIELSMGLWNVNNMKVIILNFVDCAPFSYMDPCLTCS